MHKNDWRQWNSFMICVCMHTALDSNDRQAFSNMYGYRDRYPFGINLNACILTKMIAKCTEWTGQFISMGMDIANRIDFKEMDLKLISTVIHLYGQAHRMDMAWPLIQKQMNDGQIDGVFLNSAMHACNDNGLWPRALKLFQICLKMKLNEKMDRVSFLMALQACAETRELQMGQWIYSHAMPVILKKDEWIQNAYLYLLGRTGQRNSLEKQMNQMNLNSTLSEMSVDRLGTVMKALNECHLFDKCIEIYFKSN